MRATDALLGIYAYLLAPGFNEQAPLNVVKVVLWCYSMEKKDANAG